MQRLEPVRFLPLVRQPVLVPEQQQERQAWPQLPSSVLQLFSARLFSLLAWQPVQRQPWWWLALQLVQRRQA